LTGDRTGLILIGNDVQAPTATTDNFNIADKIKCDLTTDVIEFGTHSAIAADTLLGQLGTMAKRLEWALWIAVIDPPRFANRN
jgi:hypothetical protein